MKPAVKSRTHIRSQTSEEAAFLAEDVNNIIKESIDSVLLNTSYAHTEVCSLACVRGIFLKERKIPDSMSSCVCLRMAISCQCERAQSRWTVRALRLPLTPSHARGFEAAEWPPLSCPDDFSRDAPTNTKHTRTHTQGGQMDV